MIRASILLAALTAGCATPLAGDRQLTGRWGGQHVGLEISAVSGRLDYDCASGTIDDPLATDAAGRFSATGTHTPGQGGPDRIDYTPPSYPARYSGSVSGDVMTLVVDVAAINARIGPYTLRRGTEPILLRCL